MAIGAALIVNTSLTELHLWKNNIGEAGARAVGACVASNRSLTFLGLSFNHINDAGARCLCDEIERAHNTTLTTLWLEGNDDITEAVQRELEERMKAHNPQLDIDF